MFKSLLKKSLVIMLLAVATGAFAQDLLLTVGKTGEVKNETILAFQNNHQTSIRFELNAAELIAVNTDNGRAFIATSDNAPLMLQEGCPEMFFLTTAFIIPDTGSSELEIAYGAYQEFDDIEIAPSKGSLLRSVDPATVPYVKGDIYQKDGFYPGTLAALREPFIMRDVRGQSVDVYPVQYNPVTKVLRLYSEITVTVTNTSKTGINEFTNQKRNRTIDPAFGDIYSRLFINSSVMQSRGYPTEEEGELLIICHPTFMDDMKPYIDWKRTMGRKTTMVSTATSGTTATAIKTYIANYYNDPNNNLAFVLFVGDAPQIPAYPASGANSDIEYGKITGSDNFLEVLIGRMSCETNAHVQTQVQRTITYERDLTTDDSWVSVGIGVAANEGSGNGHDGGEADYVHMDNIRNRMLTYGYNPVWQEYSGVGGGTTPAQINQRLDGGTSVLNYCNHGSETSWSVANYSTTNVNQLQNANKLPFLFLVACLNGQFLYSQPCLSEVFMRHTYNNQPAGAIAVFGATISIGWQPPMTAQDEFVNITLDLPSPYSGTQPGTKRTIAGAMLNASQKMIMVHSGSTADYNSWLVFGDPTLNFRTKTPQEMAISHLPVLLLGMNALTVNCDAEGAVAAVTYIDNDEVIILGTATVTGGIAEVTFAEPLSTPMDLTLTVTGFNKVAYQAPIQAIPASGPYVVHDGYAVTGGGELTYISTNKEIEVTLKNVGSDPTTGTLTVTITSDDPQLTIVNGTAQHTTPIAPDGTATVKFNVTVANDITDGKTFPLDFTVTPSGADPWISKLPLKAYAPNLKLDNVLINGVEGGSLIPGALTIITTVVKNDGGADTYNLTAALDMSSPYLTLACDDGKSRGAQNLLAGESMNFDFYVICDPAMPYGYTTDFNLMLAAQYGIEKTIPFDASCSGSDSYCIPTISSGCNSNDKFTLVKLTKVSDGTVLINHDPGCNGAPNGYIDYTSIIVPIEPGAGYKLDVTMGSGGTQYIKGWFDLNGNNEFEEPDERLINGSCSANGSTSFTFTAPQDFTPGNSRFRLRCQYNSAPTNACSNGTYGHVLDYTIVLPELYARVQNVVAVLDEPNITVTWDAPASGTPTGYNVYRNNELLNATPLTTLNFTEENITQGIYVYNVTALYAGNKESFAEMSNVICNFLACEPPTNFAVTVQGTTAIITWEEPAVIEDELLGYEIYRDGEMIGETEPTVLEYQDKDLTDGTYAYQVRAIYANCESDLTEEITITIEIGTCEPPTNLEGVAEGKTAVLTWEKPENVEGELLYNIYRDGNKIEENFAALEYRDEDLSNGTYTYKVTAVYDLCESEPTEEVTVEIDVTNICTITADTFRIFPNPAYNELNITGSLVPTSVRLYNITGQLVYETTTCAAKMSIAVSSMPTGVYFIKIDTEYGNVTKKVVVN